LTVHSIPSPDFLIHFLRYLYDGGNYLSVASYGSLLAAFTAALTEKLEIDEYSGYQVTIHFKNVR
jgi:hypothetical protein